MRRSFGKLSQPAIGHTSRQTLISSSSSSSSSFDFSTSAGNGGGGGGRGRGRGSDFPKLNFIDSVASKNDQSGPVDDTSLSPPLGRGQGKPLQSNPDRPPFSSYVASSPSRGTVAGRGRGTVASPHFEEHSKPRTHVPMPQSEENSRSRAPIFFRKDEQVNLSEKASSQDQFNNQGKSNLPSSILSILSGAGRGKPTQASSFVASEKVEEVNRHMKARKPVQPLPTSPRLSQEEAVNKARSILSRGDGGMEGGGSETQGGSRGVVGRRGGRGRGQRGGWSGRGRGRGRGRGMQYRDDDDNEDDEEETESDKANLEKLARILGPEKMDVLVEAFEEASAKVLPSLETDAHVDAMHTNLLLECEPEYLMAEFDSNPDIDEKPPIPLQDALEKMKPFLMNYENIQTNKEWQKVVEETMKNVPLMKELVDYYSGPDRVTAKKQQEELERVANTLPANASSSLKRFTDRAVLSLQSNPGWGFDKKCQFMDKLVREVSQNCK